MIKKLVLKEDQPLFFFDFVKEDILDKKFGEGESYLEEKDRF